MLRSLPAVLVLTLLSLAFAGPAHAILITVNFTGANASGNFTFDSAIIATGGGTVGALNGLTDYASSISVTDFYGQTWDSSNAGVNYMTFDAANNLTGWVLGGDVNGIGGSTILFLTNPFAIDVHVFTDLGGVSEASNGGNAQGGGSFTWSFSPQPPYDSGAAPGPASWLLLSGALVGLVRVRRRVRG